MRLYFACWPAVVVLLLNDTARAVVIDDFTQGPVVVDGPEGAASQTGLDPAQVIGGQRDILVERTGDRAQVETGKGRFHVSTDESDYGYVHLMYGLDQPLGIDLTANGHDRIRFRFDDVSRAGVFWTYVNRPLPPSGNGLGIGSAISALGGYGVVEVPYSVYGADFTNVENVAVYDIRIPPGSSYAIQAIVTAGPPLPGDFNRDSAVDNMDYHEWRRMFGASTHGGVLLGADGNFDGRVDSADYTIWRDHFQTDEVSTVASVPEPATLVVALIVAIGSTFRVSRFAQNYPRGIRGEQNENGK